jgi:DNA-binding Xre family transcriptional regulator
LIAKYENEYFMERRMEFVRIGVNIRKIRCEKRISQQDLAAACNFEKSNMSRIEAGRTNLTIGTLLKICEALGVRLTDVIGDA